ncbi:MAG: hypothetical protein IJE93_08060 [Clostridia bacterium]|nr:hypothetical protein [Clostridia bacterium]
MKETVFRRLLVAVIVLGILITVAHLIYIIYAYQHSSIIYFISKELW